LGDTKVVDAGGVNPYQLVCIFIPQGVLLAPPLDYQHETRLLPVDFSAFVRVLLCPVNPAAGEDRFQCQAPSQNL
jgi:hypothetical protein